MSLQVWLPLTKDLRQQGLSNATVSIMRGSETWDNNGKLGKCFHANGVNTLQINNIIPQLYNVNGYSLCAWFYIESQNTVHNGAGIVSGGNWNNQVLNLSVSDWSSDHYTRLRVSGTNWNHTYTYNFYKNIWYHAVVCSDGNKTYAYINGQLIGDTVAGFLPSSIEGNNIAIGGATYYNGMQFFGKINDVRIYDHCLSPMEVKELAKGLILHYPLNRNGWGQENLLRGSNVVGSGTTTYGWVSNGSATNIEILSDGSLHYKYNISNSKYIPSITTNTVVPCEFSKTYFYSMDLKFDKAITLGTSVPAHYWVGARNSDSITNTSCNGNLTGIQTQFISNHSGTLPANTWVHITTKFTFPAAATSSGYNYPAIRCFVYGSVLTETTTGEVNVWMKNCKVEEGSIETPWCPHIEDELAITMGINDSTEYDCSGFCNNGTRIGSLGWTSDTPKYNVSTHIGTTSSKIHISNFPTSGFGNSYSFAWWGKRSSNTPMFWGFSDGIRLNGMYIGTLWNTGDGSNNPLYNIGTTTQVTAPSTNTWHHYVMTGNGTKCYVYLDGELWGEAKTYKAISGTSIYINGWDSGTQYCSDNTDISDFRIYATALSADDVKSLYQNSAYIDSSGNVYGAIHMEA